MNYADVSLPENYNNASFLSCHKHPKLVMQFYRQGVLKETYINMISINFTRNESRGLRCLKMLS